MECQPLEQGGLGSNRIILAALHSAPENAEKILRSHGMLQTKSTGAIPSPCPISKMRLAPLRAQENTNHLGRPLLIDETPSPRSGRTADQEFFRVFF